VAGQAEAVVVKSELAQVGINVDIQSYELLTAYDKEDNGHSQMGERYWTNDIIDPDEVATFGADCKGGANAFNSYWCSTEATKAGQTRPGPSSDPAKRQEMYSQIQQIVYDESPYLVVDYSRTGTAWVTGCTASTSPRSATTSCPWRR